MGVLAASGRLGAVSAQFVNGSLEKNIPLLLFVTSACTVVGGLIAWLLPHDTVGSAMQEFESELTGEEPTRRSSSSAETVQQTSSPLTGGAMNI